MVKRLARGLVFVFWVITFLTGCSLPVNPLDAVSEKKTAPDELLNGDLAAIEGALLANRILVAVSFADPSIVVLDGTVEGVTSFSFRGKTFGATGGKGTTQVFREKEGCRVSLVNAANDGNTSALIGTEPCRLEKNGTNGYILIRENGHPFKVTGSGTTGGEVALQVKNIDWTLTFPTGSTSLCVLKNPKTGRMLDIQEDSAGTISVTTEKKGSFKGGWSTTGVLALIESSTGTKCLYRAGQWYFPPGM
jgi:hypothetical protein